MAEKKASKSKAAAKSKPAKSKPAKSKPAKSKPARSKPATDFEANAKKEFEKLKDPEFSFTQFREFAKADRERVEQLRSGAREPYVPRPGAITPCGNGDFETSIDPDEWQGAYGSLNPADGFNPNVNFPFADFTDGIYSDPNIASPDGHQTWVGPGTDPNAPISTVAPGSTGAVRIGNAARGWGCELISKTFIVPADQSTIAFWYAVVMQNPDGHTRAEQPMFWVRVTDQGGGIISGAFDFGNGSDRLIADRDDPFFTYGGGILVYRDWSCAQIDLSSQVGKQVTIELVAGDCGQGGHWGYAYVDNFCGSCAGSPTGNLSYDCAGSSHCGPGEICFDYELPTVVDPDGNVTTGEATIELELYQNGTLFGQLNSGVLTSGSRFCFDINPANLAGIDASLPGFDFVGIGKFRLGNTNLGTILVGAAPDGVNTGQNNDYALVCKTCEDIELEQNQYLNQLRGQKANLLQPRSCHCPDSAGKAHGAPDPVLDPECECRCGEAEFSEINPCIEVAWGDSICDCFETDDTEIVTVTVHNCYSNIAFDDFTIGQILITNLDGTPVPLLPNGDPSVEIVPSGPVCFGDIGPCRGLGEPGTSTREFMVRTRGAKPGEYKLSFIGICFNVVIKSQTEACFTLKLCED